MTAILEYGDIIVVNNVALRHFNEGQALAEWLDGFGVTLVYIPVYSPELTPVQLVLKKMKMVLHIGMNTGIISSDLISMWLFTVRFKRSWLAIYMVFMVKLDTLI